MVFKHKYLEKKTPTWSGYNYRSLQLRYHPLFSSLTSACCCYSHIQLLASSLSLHPPWLCKVWFQLRKLGSGFPHARRAPANPRAGGGSYVNESRLNTKETLSPVPSKLSSTLECLQRNMTLPLCHLPPHWSAFHHNLQCGTLNHLEILLYPSGKITGCRIYTRASSQWSISDTRIQTQINHNTQAYCSCY